MINPIRFVGEGVKGRESAATWGWRSYAWIASTLGGEEPIAGSQTLDELFEVGTARPAQ